MFTYVCYPFVLDLPEDGLFKPKQHLTESALYGIIWIKLTYVILILCIKYYILIRLLKNMKFLYVMVWG
jgi:hypothetical protein